VPRLVALVPIVVHAFAHVTFGESCGCKSGVERLTFGKKWLATISSADARGRPLTRGYELRVMLVGRLVDADTVRVRYVLFEDGGNEGALNAAGLTHMVFALGHRGHRSYRFARRRAEMDRHITSRG
jgi:hypothetical protein